MILVDTSVWIDFFSGKPDVVTIVRDLIDSDLVVTSRPIRLELKAGVSAADEKKIFRHFDAMRTFDPELEEWQLVEAWISKARSKGHVFSLVDLLIGATSRRHDLQIWSMDSDFHRMEKLGFVQLFRPRDLTAQ